MECNTTVIFISCRALSTWDMLQGLLDHTKWFVDCNFTVVHFLWYYPQHEAGMSVWLPNWIVTAPVHHTTFPYFHPQSLDQKNSLPWDSHQQITQQLSASRASHTHHPHHTPLIWGLASLSTSGCSRHTSHTQYFWILYLQHAYCWHFTQAFLELQPRGRWSNDTSRWCLCHP